MAEFSIKYFENSADPSGSALFLNRSLTRGEGAMTNEEVSLAIIGGLLVRFRLSGKWYMGLIIGKDKNGRFIIRAQEFSCKEGIWRSRNEGGLFYRHAEDLFGVALGLHIIYTGS